MKLKYRQDMLKKIPYMLVFLFGLLVVINAKAQQKQIGLGYWTDEENTTFQSKSNFQIQTNSARYLSLDITKFRQQVGQIPNGKIDAINTIGTVLNLPLPDGKSARFIVIESSILAPKLAKKFPQIKTYLGQGIDDPSATIRFDITPKGFHAIIFGVKNTIYIDPINTSTDQNYIAYYKKKFVKKGFERGNSVDVIGKPQDASQKSKSAKQVNAAKASGTELRTYRIAIAATGEYTTFHGGTVLNGLSAIATTMNRVTGIFERELAISFSIVGDNDAIIYTNSSTDPFTNNDTEALLDESQATIDTEIGTANYDIGHVFSTASGGLAQLQSVCSTLSKAKGTTGIANPVGDPFDVDFVSHEIGHQFGATHTFNGTSGSCAGLNRSSITAYEPGSGTTIMGYAGICAPQNVQNNSNDYFHTASFDQMITFSTENGGNNCPTTTATGNTVPTVDAGANFTIPVGTSFTLTGTGNDVDGDVITYCWEQFNLGPASAPNVSTTIGPLFRSFAPVTENFRTFPQIADIVANSATVGEILPSTPRTMDFRLTVRDNRAGGGGVNYDNTTVNVVDNGGSFEVTSLNTPQSLTSSIPQEITWNVSGTNLAPINTTQVNILLSTDGGLTFPTTLASNIDNNGQANIILPNTATSNARIKIEAVNNIFFDINNSNFTIEVPTDPGFFVSITPTTSTVCSPDNAIYEIELVSVLGFTDDVTLSLLNLPSGLTADFSTNPVTPGSSTTLTLSGTDVASPDNYTITISGISGAVSGQADIDLTILSGEPFAPVLSSPVNEASGVSLKPTLSWNEDNQVDNYLLEIATDIDFMNIIETGNNLTGQSYEVQNRLDGNTTYFWRLKGFNTCGEGSFSSIFSFTTLLINYFEFVSTDVPVTISDGAPPITAISTVEINIVDDLIISDINVKNLIGDHSYLGDLTITLISPGGTEVILFANICGNQENFNLNFDDEATSNTIPCPATDGGNYQPSGSLSDFIGENARGLWTLRIEDNAAVDGGVLNSWALDIGTAESRPKPPSNLIASGSSTTSIAVSWDDNSNNETNFVLERSSPDNNDFQVVATLDPDIASYDDSGLDAETIYFYRLKATNSVGETAYTQEVESSTLAATPDNLTANVISFDQIDLSWNDNSMVEDNYVLEQSIGTNDNFSLVATLAPNTTSFSLKNLDEETTYFFRVFAKNTFGNSAYSEEINATTLILSVNDKIKNSVVIYPNPSSHKITVQIDQSVVVVNKLRLTDINGKTIYTLPPGNRLQNLEIDLSERSEGTYLLEIDSNKGKIVKRIIRN